ncbi:hypothetical protein BJAS_P2375 [Bathymodiolus japonicus methanotrophic gill symbiont]|nr:hypothetical protein BJAS_P2375 [Bathymodiolus japonicus methanotrophic gill symbiont]
MLHHIKWGLVHILFWATLLFAIGISGLRYALSELGFYKADIEALVSKQLGAPVTIANIQGVLNGFKPELALKNIQVHSGQDQAVPVQLQEIHLGFSIFTAIRKPLLEAIQISIFRAKLSVTRLQSGGINIKGLPSADDDPQPTWLLRGRQYKLIDSEILWHDEKRNALPVLLKHINITLKNDADQHQIYIKTELPESLGKSLFLAMHFRGNIFVPKSVNARLFIQGQDIHLKKFITGDLPFGFAFTQGRVDFSIWSRWQAEQMTQMRGNLDLSNAAITDKHNALVPINQLAVKFLLQQHQQQWQLGIKDLLLSSKNNTVALAQFALALELDAESNLTHLALNAPQLLLEPISKFILLSKLLPKKQHKQLKTLALQGEVKELLLLANPAQQTFAINGQLSAINSQPIDATPGVKNLNLYIKGSDQQGMIQIDSPQFNLNAPKIFRKPLQFNHALGNLHWQHDGAWVLSTPLLELNSAYFKTRTKCDLTFAHADQPAFMSMQNSFDIGNAADAPELIPAGVLDEQIVAWVDQAFIKGHVKQGGILLHGALPSYPFPQRKGVFEVLFDAKDVELHYAPDWHDIQGVLAEVRFFSNSMDINIQQGHANDSSIQNINVAIDSFSSSQYIDITGKVKSSLAHAVRYLLQSPFKGLVTAIDEVVGIQGATDINIDLKVPLYDQALHVNISAKTKDANAVIVPLDLEISNISGDFLFTENGVYSQNITAISMGSPLTAVLNTDEQAISTKVTGKMSIAQLAKQFPNPLWAHAQGTSTYRIALDFPIDSEQICTIKLNSDLVGTAILFAPFSKPQIQKHPLSIKLGIAPSGIDAFNLTYENRLALQDRVEIKLKKITPHWQGLIHTPIASGSVFIPIEFNHKTELSLALKELDLSALQKIKLETNGEPLIVQNLPSIKLKSQELYWNNINLGKLELQTQPTDLGLETKHFEIKSLNSSLSLSGYWHQDNQQQSSSISGVFLSEDFGMFLKQNQLSNNILNTTADLQFVLNWPSAPYDISMSALSGSIDSHLSDGRILGVDPGLGRVLGALDIWKIGKRLRFDFSDITDSGLSFSEATGHFSINDGLVTTKYLMINAMPAKMYISGNTNLTTEQIDLQATVLPKFPIAGTIIGNVANAVSKTFVGNEHAGGLIVSLLYEIKGSWENFKINRQFNADLTDTP